jgi:heme exporter protein A
VTIPPVLEARDLQCERGGRTLFRGLSFLVEGGARLRIAGANGSGKTSLLRVLCGLLEPAAGEVRWRGSAIGALREEFSRELVYLGHAPAVKDDLTAAENLAIACRIAGLTFQESVLREALAQLGTPADVPLRRLSQGQRRRAALARLAVSAAVPLWLLDEPYAALDTQATAIIDALIAAHAARGGAIIFTTHHETGATPAQVLELHA